MTHELAIQFLQYIRTDNGCNRSELAAQFGVSLSQVSKIVGQLLALNLVTESDMPERAGSGRPAQLLRVNPSAACVAGIEAGSDLLTCVIADLQGEVLSMVRQPTEESDFCVRTILDLLDTTMNALSAPRQVLTGLGVGIHHIVDPVTGMVFRYGNKDFPPRQSNFDHLPFLEELADQLDLPHILVDDIVRIMGVAEARYGDGQGIDNFVFLLLDHGIGMAIMVDGAPYIGASHIAGEIAHLPIRGETKPCSCGNQGCLSTLVNFPNLISRTRELLEQTPIHSSLRQANPLSIADLLQAAEEGDKAAVKIMIDAGEWIGEALSTVLNLFGPNRVIFSGALAKSSVCRETAERVMRLRALEMASAGVEVKLTALDDLAGARGAASLALDALFEPGPRDIVRCMENSLTVRRQSPAP